jgi:hypothetical protein
MSQLKGKTVYMIMYNYADCDYSVIKIMENLDDAFKYICDQETNMEDLFDLLDLLEVNHKSELLQKSIEDDFHVCYIKSGNYSNFDLCNFENLSNYVIVPMVIG